MLTELKLKCFFVLNVNYNNNQSGDSKIKNNKMTEITTSEITTSEITTSEITTSEITTSEIIMTTENTIELVTRLSQNFTKIIPRSQLSEHKKLDWGKNGIGDRWANKKFNYSSIQKNGTIHLYSENDTDCIQEEIVKSFLEEIKNNNKKEIGIIGIFVHSVRQNIESRPIRNDIKKYYQKQSCVVCGSNSDLVCDHKNDLYNDPRVLSTETQELSDFQSLCNHCNLQKRQVCKIEKETNTIYSAKNIPQFKSFPFEFTWENKPYDLLDINTKKGTYWYDPIEFTNAIGCAFSKNTL